MSLAAPVTFSVVAGTLPPGLILDVSGFLSGIPNTPGTYDFTIRATGADANFTLRSYTMAVGEITPGLLSDANTSDPYAEALTADGFSGTVVWSIVSGVLPDPLELNPNTGVISGDAPTEDGDFDFTVQATDGSLTCTKSYVLHVEGASTPEIYWTLEGPAPAVNHDELTGDLLTYNSFGGVPATVAGKVALGLEITGGFCTVQQQGPTLAYTGPLGFSIAFWINWDGTSAGLVYQWDNIGIGQFINWDAGSGSWQFAVNGVDISGNVAGISTGAWHFIVFTYTDGGAYRYSLDGGALTVLGTPPVPVPIADPLAYALFGNENYLLDEVGMFPLPLSAAQIAYLYNGGAGRTWPLTLPP